VVENGVVRRLMLVSMALMIEASCMSIETRNQRHPPAPARSGGDPQRSVQAPVSETVAVPPPPVAPVQQSTAGGSSGCQVASTDTGIKNSSIRVGRNQRSFIRVVDAKYSNATKHALVIGYHGLGLDGNSPRKDHKWTIVEAKAADQAIFIYANALGGSWDAGNSTGDIEFFDEMVRTTGEIYCIDPKRVFVHGFSNGAFFVNNLVKIRKDAIRGVISVAGGGLGATIPAMVIHGHTDQTVSFTSNAPTLVNSYAGADGCTTPVNMAYIPEGSCQTLTGCPDHLPVVFCPWDGNHHWPEFTLPDVWKFISALQ